MFKSISIFSGTANPELGQAIAAYLELPLGRADITRFSDGEVFARIQENVRGVDVYVVQSTCTPVNDNLMELLVCVDALKRASAASITAVLPYYGYARQDRKASPRTPITAKLIADLLTAAGIARVVAVELTKQMGQQVSAPRERPILRVIVDKGKLVGGGGAGGPARPSKQPRATTECSNP